MVTIPLSGKVQEKSYSTGFPLKLFVRCCTVSMGSLQVEECEQPPHEQKHELFECDAHDNHDGCLGEQVGRFEVNLGSVNFSAERETGIGEHFRRNAGLPCETEPGGAGCGEVRHHGRKVDLPEH